MDLSDIARLADEQEAGRWFELMHPVTGAGTGIRLLIVGPDSKRSGDAVRSLQSAVLKLQDKNGKIDPAKGEEAYTEHLARFVLDWEATEAGERVPFSFKSMVRLIRAGKWIQSQIAAYTQMRAPYSTTESVQS